jgi:nitrile hydratase subunit beta
MSYVIGYISHADLGGQLGHGTVVPEAEGELFHAPWEARAMALTVAMGATGSWNIDAARSARETLPNYLQLSYYQIWIAGLQKLLMARGMLATDEISASRAQHTAPPVARTLRAADVPAVLARGGPTLRPDVGTPRFAVGDWVRTQSKAVPHHTRLPSYVRGKRGRVATVHGTHVFPDTNAQGLGEQPTWLYTVVFDEQELWGSDAPQQRLHVSVDAFEPYLASA